MTDTTEEWPEATEATPKRVIRVRGRIVSIQTGATLGHAVDALYDGDERIRAAVALTLEQAREARERDPERAR